MHLHRTPLALAATFLLALSGPLSAAADRVGLPQDLPTLPPPPRAGDTLPGGAPPIVDRTTEEAYAQAQAAYATAADEYRTFAEAAGGIVEGVPVAIELYRDGAGQSIEGSDARRGGFGPVLTLGGATWNRTVEAAGTGAVGYAVQTGAGGRYPTGTQAMLVTPELDLNTAFAGTPLFQTFGPTVVKGIPVGDLTGLGAVFGTLYPDAEPRLTFDARFNLGRGRDGVTVMGFAERPTTLPDINSCRPPDCVFLTPRTGVAGADPFIAVCNQPDTNINGNSPPECSGYQEEDLAACPAASTLCEAMWDGYRGRVASLEGRAGFTGTADWDTYTVPLSRFIGRSVWVGFYFAARPAPTSDYFQTDLFSADAGFYGFHLDNLRATAPAAHDNLQVRPLREPSFVAAGRELPTISPSGHVNISTEVRNTGTVASDVQVRLQVLSRKDGVETVLNATLLGPYHLPPGGVQVVSARFPAPGNGITQAFVRVALQRLVGGTPRPDLGPDDPRDANATDDAREVLVEIASVHALFASPMQRSVPSAAPGEKVRLTLPITNMGTEPADITLLARLVDLADPTGPTTELEDLLPPSQVRQNLTIAPGDSKVAAWDVGGPRPGHYRLFVHDERDPGFEAKVDLLPGPLQPLRVPYVNRSLLGAGGEITFNGQFPATELAWTRGLQTPLAFRQQVGYPLNQPDRLTTGTLRMFHDGDFLYVGLTAPALTGARSMTVLFDDKGDQAGLDGREDGLAIGLPVSADTTQDLHFDAETLSFVPDASQGVIERGVTGSGFEFRRQLGSANPDDLSAKPGDRLGLFLKWASGFASYHFPPGSEYRDGGHVDAFPPDMSFPPAVPTLHYGLTLPDGSLTDEMTGWQLLELEAMPTQEDLEKPHSPVRVLGPGFGLGVGPPPLYQETTQDGCPSTWVHTSLSWDSHSRPTRAATGTPGVQKWNCGPLEPGGRPVFFEGIAQDGSSLCSTGPCPPYSLLSPLVQGPGTISRVAFLTTPPIEMGAATSPWLILEHQVSADLRVCDGLFTPAGGGGFLDERRCIAGDVGSFEVLSAARVHLEYWDPDTRSWGGTVLLVPPGGYMSEESAGIADPARFGPAGRRFETRDSPCTAATLGGADKGTCGWWHPSGFLPVYRPPGETIPTGGFFTGSPWQVDRIPLFGQHGADGATLVDVAGRIIRFRFAYVRSLEDAPAEQPGQAPIDFGWRIGSVTVTESSRFEVDIGVADVRIGTDLFDPVRQGVGPETDLPVTVKVRNEGARDVSAFTLKVTGIDPQATGDARLVCQSPVVHLDGLAAGEALNVTTTCPLPDRPGAQLRLGAEAQLAGDGFLANNRLERREVYDLKPSEDVAVLLGASPLRASDSTLRRQFITMENHGNVPLSGLNVTRRVFREGPDGGELLSQHTRTWRLAGTLPVGATLPIESAVLQAAPAVIPETDLHFDPPATGEYKVVVEVRAAGDGVTRNNRGEVLLKALQDLYGETFDGPPLMDPSRVTGSLGLDPNWSVVDSLAKRGRHLALGNPETAEVPPNSDAVVRLPWIDLGTMRDGTLSFSHRFDLEAGFDAGRIEASIDGTNWAPLEPVPQPLGGLPDGYSSLPMFGPHPMVGDAAAAAGVAFTGRSAETPDGFVQTEVSLASHPGLRQPATLDAFSPQGFHPTARPLPVQPGPREVQFTHPSWVVPSTDGRSRYWFIQNGTQPAAHSGTLMWWSGSSGESSFEHRSVPVCTALGTQVALNPPGAPRPGERIVLRWWEWRSGWQDTSASPDGTGGAFDVAIALADGDQDGLPDVEERLIGTNPNNRDTDGDKIPDGAEHYLRQQNVEYKPDPKVAQSDLDSDGDGLANGWERVFPGDRESDSDGDGLTSIQEQSQGTNPTLRDSDADGVPDGEEVLLGTDPRRLTPTRILERQPDGWTHREADLTTYRHETVGLAFTYVSSLSASTLTARQMNQGWLVDDVAVESVALNKPTLPILPMQDMETLGLDPETGKAGIWSSELLTNECSQTKWTLVDQVPRSSGGWHVRDLEVPGRGNLSVWRFAAENRQGYPHLADSRLVTPLVDLSRIVGAEATLRFTHKFGFEGFQKGVAGGFFSATDGGAVEFQVLDEATGEFGPWQQLFRGFRNAPDRLLFQGNSVAGAIAPTQLFADAPFPGQTPNRQKLALTGYTAVEERGPAFVTGQPLPTVPTGHGYSFEPFPGLMRHTDGSWRGFPVSYVFSGASQGTDGWREDAWDISPLRGKQVRFAFHAQSNPGYVEGGSLPFRGWAVADVAVEGEMFSGRPVQVRLRAATDGSLTKGIWDVDDLRVVGTPFTRGLRLALDQEQVLSLPGLTLDLTANLTNVGVAPRLGLALAVSAIDAATKQAIPLEVVAPAGAPVDPASVVVSHRAAQVIALGTLDPLQRLPIHLRLGLPESATRAVVQVAVLEASGPKEALTYGVPVDDAGSIWQDEVRVVGEVRQDLRLVPPRNGLQALLVATPGNPAAGAPVRFEAVLANHGSTTPAVQARWTVAEILRKGPPADREDIGLAAEELGAIQEKLADPVQVPPGGTLRANRSFAMEQPGLYRATATFLVEGVEVRSADLELLVGKNGTHYRVDFSTPQAAAWQDRSPVASPGSTTGGGSPPSLMWRLDDQRLLWGANKTQVDQGITYCTAPGAACDGAQSASPSTYTGLEGIAVGPPINLTRVPQGGAFITLRHGHAFEQGDGGRLEARPLATPWHPEAERAAFVCPGGEDAWFVVPPTAPLRGQATSIPGGPAAAVAGNSLIFNPTQVNPLAPTGPQNVVGGPAHPEDVTEFDLSTPAVPLCSEVPRVSLLNYTVEFRFRVGTLPGVNPGNIRQGGVGWQLQAMQVSSVNLAVEPSSRAIPILDGAPKLFLLEVANTGAVADVVRLGVDLNASTIPDASWVSFHREMVPLDPGERVHVPYTVAIPPSAALSRGLYTAILTATSTRNPLVERQAEVDLVLDPNPLPDLDLKLAVDAPEELPTFEAGTVAVLHTSVFNLGGTPSRGVPLVIRAVRPAVGYESTVGTAHLPPLCPLSQCQGAVASTSFEWQVPAEVGLYNLVAEVDPDGRQTETKRTNNVVPVAVRVVPPMLPDVRVDSLHVKGIGPDGFVEEGTLVEVIANITNAGIIPARDVQVRILAGSSELAETALASLGPAETRSVRAFKAVAAGETVLTAVALVPSGADADADNNELRRLLRVRGHALGIALDPRNITLAPGDLASVAVIVHNRGNAIERVVVALEGPEARGWGAAVQPNPTILPANGTVPVMLVLRVPADAPSGLTPLRVTVRPVAVPSMQANATLNATVLARTAAPRLAADPLTVQPGSAAIPFRLESQSNLAQRFDVALRSPSWGVRPLPVTLPPSGHFNGTLPVAIPTGTPPGRHEVELEVSNRTGTVALLRSWIQVTERVDFRTRWERAAHGPESPGSKQLLYHLNVTNVGNVAGRVQLVPRDLAPGHAADPVVGGLLAPGASALLPLQVLVRPDAPAGPPGRVEAWVSPGHEGAAQRVAVLDLPLPGAAPNLVLGRIEVLPRGEVALGDSARLLVRVDNRGDLPSPPTTLSAYVNGALVQDIPVGPIQPDGSLALNVTWRATAPGTLLVTVVADGTQGVAESSEDDNGGSVEVMVKDGLLGRLKESPSPGVAALLLLLGLAARTRRRRGDA